MTKFRRKPVQVQAVRWDGTEASAHLCLLMAGASFEVLDPEGSWNDDPDVTAVCKSDLRGKEWVPMYNGDYLVVDEYDRLFPLRGVLFEEHYEQWGD